MHPRVFQVISPELTASSILALASNGSTIAAVDSALQVLRGDDDGVTWSRAGKIESPAGLTFAGITALNHDGSVWVATGNFRSVSTDLESWDSDRIKPFINITHDGNRFITVSSKPYASSDGTMWEYQSAAPAIGGSNFLQSAPVGTLSFGLSGLITINNPADAADDWDTIYFPGDPEMNDGAAGNGVFVGVGEGGLILASPALGPDYAAWVLTKFGSSALPSMTSPFVDPEGDGIFNIEEYARDTDPNNPTPPLELTFSAVSSFPYSATLSFEQAPGITEVVGVIEYSENLREWRSNSVVRSEYPSSNGTRTTVEGILSGNTAASPFFMRVNWLPAAEN